MGDDVDPLEEFTINLVVGHLADRHFREAVTVADATERRMAESLLKILRAGI